MRGPCGVVLLGTVRGMDYRAEVVGLEPHGLGLNSGFPCPSSVILVNYLISLCPCFLISKMGIILCLRVVGRIRNINTKYEMLIQTQRSEEGLLQGESPVRVPHRSCYTREVLERCLDRVGLPQHLERSWERDAWRGQPCALSCDLHTGRVTQALADSHLHSLYIQLQEAWVSGPRLQKKEYVKMGAVAGAGAWWWPTA